MKVIKLKMREARFWPKIKFKPTFFRFFGGFLETVNQGVNASE
jgi:hypothetical protein